MNFNEAEAEIRAFFEDAWGGASPITPIQWPDVKKPVPDAQTWVRFTCQETDGRQASIGSPGSNRFRHFGLITIQIFQPEGQASKDARTKATTALGAFMGAKTDGGIYFYDAYARQVGNDGNGFYQINVIVPFYYDEIT
jgi:hypothetical protein